MNNTIEIDINPKLNPIDKSDLMACKSQLEELDKSFSFSEANFKDKNFLSSGLPSSMSGFVGSMKDSIIQQRNELISAMKSAALGESISADVITGLKQGIAYLSSSLSTLFSSSGNVGKAFSSLPSTMMKSFEREFSDLSKSASSIIGKTIQSMGPQTDSALVSILKANQAFQKGTNAFASKFGFNEKQVSDILNGVVQYITPSQGRASYFQNAIDKSKGTLRKHLILPEYATYKDRLPSEFRNMPDVPKATSYRSASKQKEYAGNLTKEQYDIVRSVARKYPAFEAALTMAGVAQRKSVNGKAGQLIMPSSPITKAEYAAALGFLDKNIFRPSLEGAPMFRHALSNSDDHAQMAMARKSSRIPTESFASFNELKSIPIHKPIYLDKPRNYGHSGKASVVVGSNVNIRPDSYQIMSLTLDDFLNGVVLDDKANKQYAYNERAAGKSVNKIISRSTYTDLLGMSGHNTYGSSSGPRRMIQLDLTDRIFEKDASGKIVFENGKPKANQQTMNFVAKLFDPANEKQATSPGGKSFSYPVINHGKSAAYVPTGIHKNGVIDLALESAYVEKAGEFIDKYGLDVFRNLVSPDAEFTTVKSLNKPIDARNRLHTPSIPLSELGGRMPNKRNVAFVDLNSITGFDGGAMFMPGYLPADAMTLRSVGFKGAGFNVDFKQMIKDVYGNVDHFYAPSWNAPDEMKKLYNSKGIEAVKRAYKDKETINKYGLRSFDEDFVDILKYDALIDQTMNKTPFYKGKSHSQIQDLFFDVADMVGGIRGVETDKGFLSKSDSISRQITQNLVLSNADVDRNRKQWDAYINTLRNNPVETMKMLFSDPNDPLDQRIMADRSLYFSDPDAIKRVNDAIIKAENDRDNQRLFSKNDAINALAVNNPFEILSGIAQRNKIKPKDTNLAQILSLKGSADQDAVALASWVDTNELGGWRYPNNVGEQFSLYNSKAYIDLLDKYGISRDVMIMNADTIKKMGGGDFDGDTVQAVRNRLAAIVKRTWDERGKSMPHTSLGSQDDIPLAGGARKVKGSDYADILYRKAASIFDMAAVSNAGDALAQGNWLDPEWAKFAQQAGADLRAMYDIDTTFAKTGVLASWSHYASGARKLGTPYVSLFKNINAAIENSDFSNVKDFSKVNFPSRYSNLTMSTLAAGVDNPFSNSMIESFIQAQEYLQGLKELEKSGNPADIAKAAYLRKNNEVMAQLVSHRAQIVSKTDEDALRGLYANWSNLVSSEYNRPGISADEKEKWGKELHETQFQLGRLNFLRNFAVTEEAYNRGEGYISSSGLSRTGRLTGESSLFNDAYKQEQDAIKAQQIAITGADSSLRAMSESIAQKESIAAALNLANNREYSWSQLHMIEKSAEGAQKWFKNYILGEKDETTPMMLLGSAFHKAEEIWAKKRIANQEDFGSPDEFQKIVDKYLLDYVDEKTNRKVFTELPTADSKLYSQAVKQRYNSIIASARMLPELLRDEDIIGAESEVHPNLGVDQFGNRLNSVGYIDLVTRNRKTGEITNWDAKQGFAHDQSLEWIDPKTGESHRYDQPVLYAGANGATRAGIISYGTGKLLTRSVPVTPEMVSNVEDRIARISSAAINLMQNPDPYMAIREGYFNSYALPGVFSNASSQTQLPLAQNAHEQFVTPNNQTFIESKNQQYTKDELTTAFSNRQRIDENINTFEELRGRLSSMERKYDKKGLFKPTTQWDAFNYQLSSRNYSDMMQSLKTFGASDEEIALFANSFDLAKEQYDKTLRAGAFGDLATFNEDIMERMLNRKTTGGARRIINEQKQIDENIEKARSAFDILNNKQDKTKDDEDALAKAKTTLDSAYEVKDQYEQMLTKEAEEIMNNDIYQFITSAQGKDAKKSDKVSLSVARFTQQQERLKESLDNLHANEKISDDKYKTLSDLLNSVSSEDYEKQMLDYLERNARGQEIGGNNRIASINRRNAAMLNQQQLQYDRYRQQRTLNGSRSRILRRYIQDENHRIDLSNQIQSYKDKIAEENGNIKLWKSQLTGNEEQDKAINQKIAESESSVQGYTSAMSAAESEMKHFTAEQNKMNAVLGAAGEKFSAIANQLGRRLFQAALKETKRFVQEFDSSMNEIQAITLKSDSEMQGIRSQTVSKAIGLRTSVSNVANTEAALYRQGLSDAEVSSRTDSIIKFATVTKLNVTEATKIITTALQNDLVPSAEQAMDALVALGDSAATTAAEIGKGMQKAAASAKVAGVSYAELTALLTIGTSDTQLSGTQVGTALQTVFSRMRRLSISGYTADQNGEKTTASDAEAALKSVGVDLWDDKTIGKMRSAYDVLSDLSKVWQNLSDAQKNIVMNALAGTRQTNVFSTLMEGMAEDGGATLDKYLGLAEGSEGITQTKYEIAMQSLAASMDTLKSSWDSVVESFTNSGLITGTLDLVSGFLQTIAGIASNGGQVDLVFSAITAGIAGMAAACLAAKTAVAPIASFLGLLAGGAILAISTLFQSGIHSHAETDAEKVARIERENVAGAQSANKIAKSNIDGRQNAINEVTKLGEAYDKLKESGTAAEQAVASSNLINSLNNLKSVFPQLATEIMDATTNLENWKEIVDAATGANNEYASGSIKSQANAIAVAHAKDNATQQKYYNDLQGAYVSEDRAQQIVGLLLSDAYWLNTNPSEDWKTKLKRIKNAKLADEQKAILLGNLFEGTKNDDPEVHQAVKTILSRQDQGVLDALNNSNINYRALNADEQTYFADAYDHLLDELGNETSHDQTAAEANVAAGTVESIVTDYADVIAQIATKDVSAEDIQKFLVREIQSKMYNDDGTRNTEYFDKNGLITKSVDDYILGFIGRAITNRNPVLQQLVNDNKKEEEYAYHIDTKNGVETFDNYEDAIQYARRNKIDYNEIKGQNGESAYQSAAKTTDALLATKDADKIARNLNTALDVIRNVSSLQELQSEYDKLGLGQELTNVLGSNDELLGLFEMMRNDIISYSEFQDYASNLAAGRTDRASLVSSIYENLISGDLSVKDFRSLPAYSGLYKTFSSIVGDSADAVLNAIEDGVQSADLTNAFNKSIIEQRIKEAMPASNYLSEAIAYATTMTTGTALQQQEYNANKAKSDTEFANYTAAINRYISGNAKPEDYATIAAMGDFSETALRNGVNKSAVRASYNTRVQARTDQLNAELQGALASLGIEGLTLDEYLAQVANREEDVYRFSELELKDEFEQAKHNLPEGIETFEQYANFRNRKIGTRSVSYKVPRSKAIDQLLANYQVDENGNLVYTPASEEYLSSAAVLTDEARQQTNKNRKDYAAIYQSLRMNRGIKSAIDDQSYAELLQQDEQLRRMLQAGANNEAIRDYVGRQLSGASGSFQDNYGWVMTSLLGGTDTSKWNAKAIRTQWANAQNNPALLQFYNEMLSSMAGGDIIKQIAQGGEGNLDEAIELYLKDYYTQLSNRYGSEFAQAIGLNQATLATGNASERFRLLSGFNQNIAQGKNAQYYLNNWSSQSAGILSSYLGMTEEEVKQADRTELQDAVNQRVKEEIIRQAESYGAKLEGIDIDSSSLSDVRSALEASLSSLSGDTKTFVENLIKQIDETGNIVGEASKSLSQIVTDTQQQMQESTYEYQAFDFIRNNAATALAQAQTNGTSIFEELSKTAGWNQEWNSIVGGNQGLIAASSLYQNGTINEQQYQDFLGMQMSGAGKNADYYSMLAGAALGQGFQNGQFTSVEALQAGIANAKGDENLLNFYTELSSKYGEFLSQIESGDNAEDALERLNEQWSQDKTNDLTKWLKNGSQAAQTLTALNKGGKDSAQAIASLRKEASQLNNAAVAIRSSAGKSGKQLSQNERSDLASVTGEDENLIREMTKEQVEQLRQRAQESIDQSFVEDFGNTIAAQLNSLMAENPVDFEMAVQAHIGSDGQLDLSEISAIAADLKNQALAELASHAGTIGQLFVELKKEGLSETAIAKVIAGSVTGTGKRTGGGGGGGGGKSAADKLLEEQKRKVAEIEHQSKMLEIQEKQYDYTNDYSGWNNNISDQIAVQEQLRAQYAANIKEMTDMLAKVKEGSDDWKKLKDAIMQAEEAMASVDNTIVELNSKRLELLDQKYEKENRPNDYNMSMLQIRSEKFQTTGQVEGYIAAAQQMIETRRNQIKTNNDQIAELEAELKSFELDDHKNRDETIKKINDLKLDNEKLDADNAKETIAIQDAQINQIANDLYNQQRSLEHANDVSGVYGDIYKSEYSYGKYRDTLETIIANNALSKEQTDAAIEEERKYIESLPKDDISRQAGIERLYELEKKRAEYDSSDYYNRQDLEGTYIDELTQGYSDKSSVLEHEMKLLQEAEKEYLRDDDFTNYENILNEEARNTQQRLENEREALEGYLELQASGKITEGTQKWRDLEEIIRQSREDVSGLSNEAEDFFDKIQNARFENLHKNFSETDELAQHNLRMIQYEETRYKNRGELKNYGILLDKETSMQENRALRISEYIESLKEQLEAAKDNPELYKKITQEIYKYEEQLSSTNNTIEKNKKLLLENEEAIRKVYIAVEDLLDKEIRTRIQTQREMLKATVSIENTILDVIRKNEQEKWNLRKKTLDKQKQALNEEKALINERLNARKEALNEEEKYEELAELQRQLALISADTTRTKDAAELRKQIADIQKDISWDLASDQANASIQAIDDEIKAIDSYTSTYEEDLNEMLSDANNFTDDLNRIMGGSFDDFLEWMKAQDETYKLSTDEAKETSRQAWEDTWKTMKHELDTYWDDVDKYAKSREGFIEYMLESDKYQIASETGRESLEYQFGKMYDDYLASIKNDAEFDHNHEDAEENDKPVNDTNDLVHKVEELKEWTFDVNVVGLGDYLANFKPSNYDYNRKTDYDLNYDPYNNYDGVGKPKKEEEKKNEAPITSPSGGTGGSGGAGGSDKDASLKGAVNAAAQGAINAALGSLYSQVDVLTGKNNPSQKDIDELKKKYPWLEGLSLDPTKKYTAEQLEALRSTHERLTDKDLEGISNLLNKYDTVSIPEPAFASSSALNQLVSTYNNNNNSGSFNLNFYGGIQVREEADIDKVATELEHKVAKTLIKQGQNNYFSLAR